MMQGPRWPSHHLHPPHRSATNSLELHLQLSPGPPHVRHSRAARTCNKRGRSSSNRQRKQRSLASGVTSAAQFGHSTKTNSKAMLTMLASNLSPKCGAPGTVLIRTIVPSPHVFFMTHDRKLSPGGLHCCVQELGGNSGIFLFR